MIAYAVTPLYRSAETLDGVFSRAVDSDLDSYAITWIGRRRSSLRPSVRFCGGRRFRPTRRFVPCSRRTPTSSNAPAGSGGRFVNT